MRDSGDMSLDPFDIRILAALQANARLSNVELSKQVHLSASQVQRRLQRLVADGYVSAYTAVLDRDRIGLGVLAFTNVSLERHGGTVVTGFDQAVRDMPEILECYAVTGEHDYLLRIVAPDLHTFSEFLMHRLMTLPGVRSVRSSVVLQEIKHTTTFPLAHLARDRHERAAPRPRPSAG
ncbi:MAG TPA: Lrp/AsnC family transcriptional regulator [Alphaproteobacteria bacterium]